MRKCTNDPYGACEDGGANHTEQWQCAQAKNESIRVLCEGEIHQTSAERQCRKNKVRPEHCGGCGPPRSSEPMSVDSKADRAGKSDADAVHDDTRERFTNLHEPRRRNQ